MTSCKLNVISYVIRSCTSYGCVLYSGLDDGDKELLENNRVERSHIENEIQELRQRTVSIRRMPDVSYSNLFVTRPFVPSVITEG